MRACTSTSTSILVPSVLRSINSAGFQEGFTTVAQVQDLTRTQSLDEPFGSGKTEGRGDGEPADHSALIRLICFASNYEFTVFGSYEVADCLWW